MYLDIRVLIRSLHLLFLISFSLFTDCSVLFLNIRRKFDKKDFKKSHYLRQVNEVNGAEILFSFDVSVSLSVRSGPFNQTSLKRLKLRTSNLTSMFPATVRTRPLKNFSKRGRVQGHVTPKYLGVKC